ncbi:MAG: NUDIX domain-containing protein [Candidatus Woesearchaeota archaeon]
MKVRSAGVVLFREGKKREYLLLKYGLGHWDLPKGILEKGENLLDAALRELKEETGISKATIIPGFKQTVSYMYTWKGKKFLKFVVFYLAKTRQKKVKLSFEHTDFAWLQFKEAVKQATFDNTKNVLRKAECWLNVKKS